MRIIFVSATGAKESGLLAILNQFINNISEEKDLYYIFVDPFYRILVESPNIFYIRINTRSHLKRILWDSFGLKNWAHKNLIKPDLIVSLQNTSVKFSKDIPQIIYYHNVLPLVPYRWNLMKKDELKLYLFAKSYPYFVKRYFHSKTYIVTQLPSTRTFFLNKFDVEEKRVMSILPSITKTFENENLDLNWNPDKVHFIYPATFFPYKNHGILVKAMKLLKDRGFAGYKKIEIHFTLDGDRCEKLTKEILKYDLQDCFVFEKMVAYNKLQCMYKHSYALLFPSAIESLGLPLIEAAYAGLKILAQKRPFVEDAIGNYCGLTMVGNNPSDWADEIERCFIKGKEHFPPYNYNSDYNGWSVFFELIENIC